jgi:hypothetical protein
MPEIVFVDTWGWLAIGHRKDPDITTMVIMQERGIKQLLTKDEHFIHVGMGFQQVP